MKRVAENTIHNGRRCGAELAKNFTLELLEKPDKCAENLFGGRQKPKS